METAVEVGRRNLCSYCGSCVSICQTSALGFKNDTPCLVDAERCNYCGLCTKVCPSINELEKPSVLKCYAAYSKNEEIRFNSSSGGFITQFLIDLLENGTIDGAIVCDYKDDVFAPQAILAKSREDIIKASASKYCPVPMNLIFKDLKEGSYAFVGLPCHIKSLRLYQNIDNKIKHSIIIAIGLFCNHTPKFQATDYVLYILGIRKKDVKKIRYRGDGWPGSMQVMLNNDHVVKITNVWDTGFGKYFIPDACLNCKDVFSDYADISVGDPWLQEYYSDKLGTSFVITRKTSAIHLIEGCGRLSINEVSYSKVFDSQKTLYEIKTQRKNYRKRRLFSRLGKHKVLWSFLYQKSRFERFMKRHTKDL